MSRKLYFTIAEASELTGLTKPTLRFYETKFPLISPRRTSGFHRSYSFRQIEYLKIIHNLIKVERFTIEGARKKFYSLRKLAKNNG